MELKEKLNNIFVTEFPNDKVIINEKNEIELNGKIIWMKYSHSNDSLLNKSFAEDLENELIKIIISEIRKKITK